MAWIFDVGRAWRGGKTETQRWAAYTVDLAIDARGEGLVALGLGGPEVGHRPSRSGRYSSAGALRACTARPTQES